jgi:hypothetical protein
VTIEFNGRTRPACRPRRRAAAAYARLRARVGAEDGFTIIEMLAASMILLTVSAPLLAVLSSAAVAQRLAQQRTGAEQLAAAQIEQVRATSYDLIGTTNGNPPGNFAPTQSTTSGGTAVQMRTKIGYVNDPIPGGYTTNADYKKVVVTVTRVRDGKQLAQKTTYVSATGAAPYNGINQVTIKAQVLDSVLSAPISNATVNLLTGPSATRSDTTDTGGNVVFPALTANPTSGSTAYYDLSTALGGYVTYPTDVSPSSAAHVQLAPGQTWNTVIRMYRTGTTLTITLFDSSGRQYTGTATVTVGASWAGQTFTFTGGVLTVTQLNGVPLVPGITYSIAAQTPPGNYANTVTTLAPASYPTNMNASAALTLSASTYTTKTLTVKVQTQSGTAVAGANVQVGGGPANTYFYGTTNSAGQVNFSVPNGATPYTLTVSSSAGSGSGTATVNTTSVTTTVKVQ